MQSVPPRGSGWVRSFVLTIDLGFAPTRYREVVLTASKVLAAKLLLQSSNAALVELFDPKTNGPVSEVK